MELRRSISTDDLTSHTEAAYFGGHGVAQDAAGNVSPEIWRFVVRDDDAVVVTAPAVPVVITGAFLASAFLSDDLSIQDYYWTAGFTELVVPSIFAVGDPTTIRLDADPTAVDGFNVDPLME